MKKLLLIPVVVLTTMVSCVQDDDSDFYMENQAKNSEAEFMKGSEENDTPPTLTGKDGQGDPPPKDAGGQNNKGNNGSEKK